MQTVNDLTGSDIGQKHGLTTYTYDANGNLFSDNSKGITGITYNLLNLPQSIPDKSTTYTYDASGQKLRRVIGSLATDYVAEIEYDNSTSSIAFIQTEEGRAVPNGTTAYNYQYFLTDHLGNSRVSFETKTGAAVQVQQDDYYPFGMEILRTSPAPALKNEYLYNKKELQENLGLYDYGARLYDPVKGQWNSIDPMAEENRRFSTYIYVEDNPIRNTDPDGMDDVETNATGSSTGEATDNAGANDGAITDKGIIRQLFNKYVKPFVQQAKNQKAKDDAAKAKRLKLAPHLKPLTNWFERAMADLNGGRDYNGINYDNDGNPVNVSYIKMEVPWYVTGPGEVEELTHTVYFAKESDEVLYVGITNNLARRAAEQLASKGINIEPLMESLTKSDARAVEQTLIEIHKLSKNGGTLINRINSIAKTNPIYAESINRGYELLKSIGYKY